VTSSEVKGIAKQLTTKTIAHLGAGKFFSLTTSTPLTD